jgi:hypothetical protein
VVGCRAGGAASLCPRVRHRLRIGSAISYFDSPSPGNIPGSTFQGDSIGCRQRVGPVRIGIVLEPRTRGLHGRLRGQLQLQHR